MNILPIANKPGYFVVSSERDPRKTYEVHARGKQCTCPSWLYRESERAGLCKHVIACLDHLEQQQKCPGCGGLGHLLARLHYCDGSGPIPCGVCDGSGLRSKSDPRLIAAADRCRAEQDNARLLELCR